MDTSPKKFPERTEAPARLFRADRKRIRTNRALSSKGILVNVGEDIQAAIDSASKDSGGIVTLVSGDHKPDYNIVMRSFVELRGEGRGASVIDFGNQSLSVLFSDTETIDNGSLKFLKVKDSATNGVVLNDTQDAFIDDIEVDNCVGDNIKLTANSDNTSIRNSTITNSDGFGINIAASTCDNTIIIGNNVADNTSGGLNDDGTGTIRRVNIGISEAETALSTSSAATSGTTPTTVTDMSITKNLSNNQKVLLVYSADWFCSRGTGTGNASVRIRDDTAGVNLVPEVGITMESAGQTTRSPCIIHALYDVPASGSRTFVVQHFANDGSTTSTMEERSFSMTDVGSI